MKQILAAAMLCALSTVAAAQPVAMIAPVAGTALRAGTAIPMKTREALTTNGKTLKVGQRVQLEVAENIMLGGNIVIPAGTPGVGEITTVRNKGMWGKSGGITARVLSLRVGDRQVRLSGTFDDKGKTGTGGVVAAAVLIPVAGFFMTGTSAVIPLGSPVSAFLDEDVQVVMGAAPSAAPLPAVAPASAPTASITPVALPQRK